jgi:hypothetical protein
VPYVVPGYWVPDYAVGDEPIAAPPAGMRLIVTIAGTEIEFSEPGKGGPYPWLSKVGTLLLAARAGHLSGVGVGESANMMAELDNVNRQAAALLGYCPRAPAAVFDDDGEPFFSGLVQSIAFGAVLTLTIEA